jgi:uncharacterized protein YdhG (YjbR/CyaY superfamily)
MRNYAAKTVDEYIANAPSEARLTLNEVRAAIQSAAPSAEEGISWGVPFYKHHGMLGGFSVFTNHLSFGFNDLLQSDVRKTLEAKGYTTGKKIIQIRFDQKVPATVIKQIVKAKVKMNEAKRRGD